MWFECNKIKVKLIFTRSTCTVTFITKLKTETIEKFKTKYQMRVAFKDLYHASLRNIW